MYYYFVEPTTGHAVLKLNKEDNGNRKFIMIEMGMYFDDVPKSRTQKVIYSENWREEKPLDYLGSPILIFKYLVIKQYEDVLDAIEQYAGETPMGLPLKYLYRPELNKIQRTLDLSRPFKNKSGMANLPKMDLWM